jgi:hypothetical protein
VRPSPSGQFTWSTPAFSQYMIPYYHSGLLVKFRCTDCDWTYRIQNPCSATAPSRRRGKSEGTVHGSQLLRVFKQNSEEVAGSCSEQEGLAESDYRNRRLRCQSLLSHSPFLLRPPPYSLCLWIGEFFRGSLGVCATIVKLQ